MNKASLARLANSYGADFVILSSANGPDMTWQEWYDAFKTDGLALWAIRNQRFGGNKPFEVGLIKRN
jgi:hypothetical protein